jgi:hypothetical protein
LTNQGEIAFYNFESGAFNHSATLPLTRFCWPVIRFSGYLICPFDNCCSTSLESKQHSENRSGRNAGRKPRSQGGIEDLIWQTAGKQQAEMEIPDISTTTRMILRTPIFSFVIA